MSGSKPHISLDELRSLLTERADKWEGEASGFWLAAHTACDGNRDKMFDWMEDVVRDLFEQLEVLKTAAQEVEALAFRQYLDWMNFHELAMSKPFEAEIEAQDFARHVSSLLTIALGADSTIEVMGDSIPASRPGE